MPHVIRERSMYLTSPLLVLSWPTGATLALCTAQPQDVQTDAPSLTAAPQLLQNFIAVSLNEMNNIIKTTAHCRKSRL